MTDIDQWRDDMAAWNLTTSERIHHLARLSRYHRGLAERYERKRAPWVLLHHVLVAMFVSSVALMVVLAVSAR